MVVLEAVGRLVPGVMGNEASADEESFADGLLEYPQYTRPAEFRGWDGARGAALGRPRPGRPVAPGPGLARTVARRPDLIEARGGLTDEERGRCWPSTELAAVAYRCRRSPGATPSPGADRAMNPTDLVDQRQPARRHPRLRARATPLKVHVRVVEGNQERVQVFQGVVIRRQGAGVRETFTVRKVSFGVGVERTFPRALADRRARSRSSAAATSAGPSSTTCATASGRPPRSRRSATPEPRRAVPAGVVCCREPASSAWCR